MKRVLSLVALSALSMIVAACVPASEELPAAGAAGFEIVPSPETQGEEFTTRDAWNVRVEKLFVQVSVAASALSLGYGSSEPYVLDARKTARVFARALPVGTARITLSLYGRYLDFDNDSDYIERIERINVDDETNERFNRLPDDVGPDSSFTPGPSVLLAVRAERAGQVITLDLALNVTGAGATPLTELGTPVEVREDQLASIELPIRAETMFAGFDDIARSDADGDGRVTASELAASKALPTLKSRIAAAIVRR